ncbi:hypothetical protein AHAS_Ahas16G0075900 [Arachis hypogaea]
MWLVVHNRLMTSDRRNRMFGANPNCHMCTQTIETILHTLRDCPAASRIWSQLKSGAHTRVLQSSLRDLDPLESNRGSSFKFQNPMENHLYGYLLVAMVLEK